MNVYFMSLLVLAVVGQSTSGVLKFLKPFTKKMGLLGELVNVEEKVFDLRDEFYARVAYAVGDGMKTMGDRFMSTTTPASIASTTTPTEVKT